jgi:hypothetical protein
VSRLSAYGDAPAVIEVGRANSPRCRLLAAGARVMRLDIRQGEPERNTLIV